MIEVGERGSSSSSTLSICLSALPCCAEPQTSMQYCIGRVSDSGREGTNSCLKKRPPYRNPYNGPGRDSEASGGNRKSAAVAPPRIPPSHSCCSLSLCAENRIEFFQELFEDLDPKYDLFKSDYCDCVRKSKGLSEEVWVSIFSCLCTCPQNRVPGWPAISPSAHDTVSVSFCFLTNGSSYSP